ncbi:hydroxyphenylacetyl-CoA thioesterase PaaI [Acinetobacter sp. ANC 3926]|uniref:Hydroxyphenylacetyl-CoA thioesterase PaaI n=3 Tax=Moraxellaceae TaxID=468 RepID=A0ABT8V1T1_9GAMM|nr:MULTISPECIES: hydroxyphenylacetyl-CoA thioesterase PaaI [Acinetobacter]MCH7291595.1 hydroxyphenylacetyl-CoA thioesterase PaaI [Acinetobacter genomosp. 15BJ]MCH7304807.1 hydroxyphenylacetyl-CoA thioesterase PaaI [Acinetobacter higginsii]MDO3658311.1 hydroxyphenylacetyl-CoA thioesterase PaaI [Acinetobacter genomosp. 15BJ]
MDLANMNDLFQQDAVMQMIGAKLTVSGHRSASVSLTVKENHTQGHGTCHGAIIFAIADSAFAIACNSEQSAVGQHCNISYIKPGKIGDTLTATAIFKAPSGRSEIYDITISNQHNEIIAEFRGISRLVTKQK